ncbi:MAG: hypothetical protein LBQ20_00450 [Rhodanobacter sp.]|jgi:hypothetical protein|nr:hypothetical protein [Rhodanobacter sp.]
MDAGVFFAVMEDGKYFEKSGMDASKIPASPGRGRGSSPPQGGSLAKRQY